MQRIIVPTERFRSGQLSPGVLLQAFYPGGKNGPQGEVFLNTPGGQGWSEQLVLGDASNDFQMLVPDIRLPANQVWPLHWHDCWTAVLVLEGECLIGDWWMQPGDVFITEPSIEYGPLVIGAQGCRLFEIFAKAHLSPGGYSPEYRDHPTLQGTRALFAERSTLNARNAGRQILPLGGVQGVTKSRMAGGWEWNLGDATDPERGILKDSRLTAGQRWPAHHYTDWHAILVMAGSLKIAGRTLVRDDYLVVEPNARLDVIEAGEEGVQLLEMCRTARGAAAISAS